MSIDDDLRWFAAQGDLRNITSLLTQGANVNNRDINGRTSLHHAAEGGHFDVVKFLIEKGAYFDAQDANNQKPSDFYTRDCPQIFTFLSDIEELFNAVKEDNLDKVKRLIIKGTNINARTHVFGWTPLHLAAVYGCLAVVRFLVEKGSDVNAKDNSGRTFFDLASNHNELEIVEFFTNERDVNGWIQLHHAAFNGQLDVVRLLIDKGADINDKNSNGHTPLHLAAFKGELDVVKLLVEKGADINAKDNNGHTPLELANNVGQPKAVEFLINKKDKHGYMQLHYAVQEGNLNVVKLFLDNNIDVEVKTNINETPLHLAALYGQLNMVKLLVEKGADISAKDNSGWTALDLASSHNALEIVEFFINEKDQHGYTQLHYAALYGKLDVVRLLIDKGADINDKNSNGHTPLHLAAAHGCLEVARFLVEEGANVNAKDNNALTPLELASSYSQSEIVECLINKKDKHGYMQLHYAAQEGNLNVVKLFLDNNIDVEVKTNINETPLHFAALYGKLDVVKLLVEKGANINAQENDGWTPLHYATSADQLNMVKLLVEKGADISAKDNSGWTALELASNYGQLEIVEFFINEKDLYGYTQLHNAALKGKLDAVKLLIDKGANVEAKTYMDKTPLHIATQQGYLDIIRILINNGANVNIRDTEGKTPLDIAKERNHTDIVTFLEHVQQQDEKLLDAVKQGNLDAVKAYVSKGGSVNFIIGEYNWTLLHYAAEKGQIDTVKFLVERGANINALSINDKKPLDLAIAKKHESVIEYLKQEHKILSSFSRVTNSASRLSSWINDSIAWLVDKLSFKTASNNREVSTLKNRLLLNERQALGKQKPKVMNDLSIVAAFTEVEFQKRSNTEKLVCLNKEQQGFNNSQPFRPSTQVDINSWLFAANVLVRNKMGTHYKKPVNNSLKSPIEQSMALNISYERCLAMKRVMNGEWLPNNNLIRY